MRTVVVVLAIIAFLLWYYPYLRYTRKHFAEDPDGTSEKLQSKVQGILSFLLKLSGVELTIRGLENIPADQAVLFVGNHRGYFDVVIAYSILTRRLGFVAKKEMKKVPLLSEWMIYVNCLFLDRNDPRDGIRMIREGVEKLKAGTCIWIFPEGTRSRGEDELDMLPFKEGSLKMAQKAGVPVIPVATTGTARILEAHFPWIRPGKVTMEFGKPIHLEELEPEQKKFAGAYTREVIAGMLKEEKERRKAHESA